MERIIPRPNTILRALVFISSMVMLIVGLVLITPNLSQGETKVTNKKDSVRELTMIFTGDIMQHMPQLEAAYDRKTRTYNYDSCFRYTRDMLSKADISVANFETTLAGKPYSGYPTFSSPDELAVALLHSGINYAATANNHCCDHGRIGIERTIRVMDSIGLHHLGTYTDSAAFKKSNPLIIYKKGFKIALLNYTYGTNGNPVPKGNIVNIIDKRRLERAIQACRDSMADKIILIIHWGEEYHREPDSMQRALADFCFEKGTDIIIGSHPHVIQPMEWIPADSNHKETFVAWSLGNALSNQRNRFTDGGAMVQLTLVKTIAGIRISDAGYLLNWVQVPGYTIIPACLGDKHPEILRASDWNKYKLFLDDSRALLNLKNRNVKEIQE